MKIQKSDTPVLYLVVLLLAAIFGCAVMIDKTAQEPPRMQLDELKARLGDPSLTIIDVRADLDEEGGPGWIKGAVLEIYNQVAVWAPKYPRDKTLVLYCAWINEATSVRAAQELMALGYKKVYVLNGGWMAWEKAGYPMEPAKGKGDKPLPRP